MRKSILQVAIFLVVLAMAVSACAPAATPTAAPATQAPAPTQAPAAATAVPPTVAPTAAPFTFGLLLVGAHNDNGWSQATYDGAQYVVQNVPNTKLVYLENVYSGSPHIPAKLLHNWLPSWFHRAPSWSFSTRTI